MPRRYLLQKERNILEILKKKMQFINLATLVIALAAPIAAFSSGFLLNIIDGQNQTVKKLHTHHKMAKKNTKVRHHLHKKSTKLFFKLLSQYVRE